MQFTTPAPITAVLEIPAGRIQLIAADREDTRVDIRPANATKSRDVKAAQQATVEYRDGVLRIATAPAANRVLGPSGSVEVTVQLPAGSGVLAKAAAAEFRGVGRLGEIAFEGAHGQVKIDEAAGIRLTAHVGDVTVGSLAGPAEISTAKGDIRIAEARRGDLVLRTQSGDVEVAVAPGVRADLDAGTTRGRVRNALISPGATPEQPVLNIHATTADGDITARSL